MSQLSKAAAELIQYGIKMLATVETVAGLKEEPLGPEDFPLVLVDRAEWYARRNGATKADYLSWLEVQGQPRCGAMTAEGRRCKNPISGGIQRSLKEWRHLEGSFCAVHGGPASGEVRQS